MKRTLVGNISSELNTALSFTLSDRYMHLLSEVTIETVVNTKGAYSVELEVNKDDECWVMRIGTKKIPLFIYEGEGNLNLVDALAYAKYPNFELSIKSTSIVNFSKLIDRYLKGVVITSLEEKRILCDYFNSLDKSMDSRICALDKGLLDVS